MAISKIQIRIFVFVMSLIAVWEVLAPRRELTVSKIRTLV